MTTKKTAVDYLLREISEILGEVSTHGLQNLLLVDAYNKAKAMEKEQQVQFYIKGCDDTYGCDEPNLNPDYDKKQAEQYYNETYEQ